MATNTTVTMPAIRQTQRVPRGQRAPVYTYTVDGLTQKLSTHAAAQIAAEKIYRRAKAEQKAAQAQDSKRIVRNYE